MLSSDDMDIRCEVHAMKNVFGIVSAYVAVMTHGVDVMRKTFACANVGTKHYDPEIARKQAWSWVGYQKGELIKAIEVNEEIKRAAVERKLKNDARRAAAKVAAAWVCTEVHRVRSMYGVGQNRTKGGYVNVYGMITEGDDA